MIAGKVVKKKNDCNESTYPEPLKKAASFKCISLQNYCLLKFRDASLLVLKISQKQWLVGAILEYVKRHTLQDSF